MGKTDKKPKAVNLEGKTQEFTKEKSEQPTQVVENKLSLINIDKRNKKSKAKQRKKNASKRKKGSGGARGVKTKNKVGNSGQRAYKPIRRGMNTKTNFSLSADRYSVVRKHFDERGDEYQLVLSGSSEKLIANGKTYVPFRKEEVIGAGYHLSRSVKKDVNDWLIDNRDKLVRRDRDYREQLFNIDNIEKNVGKVLVAIDINDCYWQTIRNLGYITEKTYINGLKRKEWKIGRNASIGGLSKAEMITTYKGGRIMRDQFGAFKRTITRQDQDLQHVRHNVIGTVYDMFLELADYLGKDFFMVLTDCIFTTLERKKEVEEFFAGYGYACKCKTFEFVGIDRKEKIIQWVDLKALDTPKYYRYSMKQIYDLIPRSEQEQGITINNK